MYMKYVLSNSNEVKKIMKKLILNLNILRYTVVSRLWTLILIGKHHISAAFQKMDKPDFDISLENSHSSKKLAELAEIWDII